MAEKLNLELQRNEDWPRAIQLFDDRTEGAEPYDITGWTIAMQVKSKLDNDLVIAEADCEIIDGPNGWFSITLKASEGTDLNDYGDPLQTENLRYDLRVIDSAGNKRVLFGGTLILSRGITHD